MDMHEFLDKYLADRRHTNCSKWDGLQEKFGRSDLLPLWIADMEFRTCDAITEALKKRVEQGIFGYSFVPDSYYTALDRWMTTRHNCPVPREWVRFSTGCVTGIAWSIAAFTQPGDACMILTPVYYPFHNVVTNNNRKLVQVPLHYEKGYATMDYEAIERAIVEQDVKLFIQCSPQNPMGRVWSEDELAQVLEICARHGVLTDSDEIHQDILPGDKPFVPAAMVKGGRYRDGLIILNSATKTFNLATLLHSHIIIPSAQLRKHYDAFAAGMNRTEVSLLGALATQTGEDYAAGVPAGCDRLRAGRHLPRHGGPAVLCAARSHPHLYPGPLPSRRGLRRMVRGRISGICPSQSCHGPGTDQRSCKPHHPGPAGLMNIQ